MTYEEFIGQVKRLQDTYGEKAYPKERIKLMWQDYAPLFLRDFKEIIEVCIRVYRAAPLQEQFEEARAQLKESKQRLAMDVSHARQEPTPCSNCDGTGLVHTKDKEGREYCYLCFCENSLQHDQRIPRVNTPGLRAI